MNPLRARWSFALFALLVGMLAVPTVSRASGSLWTDPAQFADAVFRLTNAERVSRGLAAFRRDARLDTSAARFSRYMGDAGFFDHVGPDGLQPNQRIEKQGYDWSWWGENIAWGYRTPQEVVEGWMTSPGHRANILNPNFADLGVGVAFVGGKVYMTQDFATARGPRRAAPRARQAAKSNNPPQPGAKSTAPAK